jgi:N-acetylglucosaminyl-diphospho-decaprenol L-rhamnosyltransferase
VAVLIVNYRVYDDVRRLLAGGLASAPSVAEVIVFDQESDAVQLGGLAHDFPLVRFVPCETNTGFAAGINRAAAATFGAPYLLLLNPDSTIEGAAIDALAGYLDEHADVASVGPSVLNSDGSRQPSARRFPSLSTAFAGRSTWLTEHFPNNWLTRHNLIGRDARQPMVVDWLAGSCLLTRRDVFERLGGLDEGFFMYWEDADYARRAKALGYTSVYVPEVCMTHAAGRSAAWRPVASIRAFHASAYRMYRKQAGPFGRLAAPAVKLALWLRGEVHARFRKTR